jgi:hypothetical protein
VKTRSDMAASSNRESQERKKWVEPVAAFLMALTTVGTAWCSYQSAAWTRQSNRLLNEFNSLERRGVCCAGFRPESFSLLSAGCLATVSN